MFVLLSNFAFAQTLEKFEIGPYEVVYYGKGDYEASLIEGFNLYDHFGLQKDTTIVIEEKTAPMKHGIQVAVTMRVPILANSGLTKVFGLEGSWKQQVYENLFVNAGLSCGVTTGYFFANKMRMIEAGIPVSLEYTNLDKMKSSLYASVGVLPAYYNTLVGDLSNGVEGKPAKPTGVYVAPRLEVGGYIPVWGQLVKIGAYAQYNTSAAVYKDYIGRAYAGGSLGIIF